MKKALALLVITALSVLAQIPKPGGGGGPGGSGSGTVSGTTGALAAFTSSTAVGDATVGSGITVTAGEVAVDDSVIPFKFTSPSTDPGSTACASGDTWTREDTDEVWACTDSTPTWTKMAKSSHSHTVTKTYGASFFKSDGSALSTTQSFSTSIPTACTVSAWTISADAGTATVKVWKKATGTAIPTIADVINTSGVALSSGTHVRSTTLTDFTDTTWSAGDQLIFALTAVATATWVTVGVECQEAL